MLASEGRIASGSRGGDTRFEVVPETAAVEAEIAIHGGSV